MRVRALCFAHAAHIGRIALIASLQACAADAPPDGRLEAPTAAEAEASAERILSATLALNHAIHAALAQQEGAIEQDMYAVMDSIHDTIGTDGAADGDLVRMATDELFALMRGSREEKLTGKTISLIARFSELAADPHNEIAGKRFANFNDDSTAMLFTLDAMFRNTNPEHAELAYRFAPAFNVVAGASLAALTFSQPTLEILHSNCDRHLETNRYLVGDPDGDPGRLFDYVSSRYKPNDSVSAREIFEADPIVFAIRRFMSEQRLVRE